LFKYFSQSAKCIDGVRVGKAAVARNLSMSETAVDFPAPPTFLKVLRARSDSERFVLFEIPLGSGSGAVSDTTLVELVLRDFGDPNDFCWHENGVTPWRVGNGDFNGRALKIFLAAPKTEAAFRHVFAGYDIIGKARAANAGLVADLGARVFAPVIQRRSEFAVRR
jgi:hypothetical protein